MDTSAASTSANNQHPSFASTGTIEVPVFYPTIEEMRDFPALINKIEQEHGAHLVCGIAKVLLSIICKVMIFSIVSVIRHRHSFPFIPHAL